MSSYLILFTWGWENKAGEDHVSIFTFVYASGVTNSLHCHDVWSSVAASNLTWVKRKFRWYHLLWKWPNPETSRSFNNLDAGSNLLLWELCTTTDTISPTRKSRTSQRAGRPGQVLPKTSSMPDGIIVETATVPEFPAASRRNRSLLLATANHDARCTVEGSKEVEKRTRPAVLWNVQKKSKKGTAPSIQEIIQTCVYTGSLSHPIWFLRPKSSSQNYHRMRRRDRLIVQLRK